MDEDLEKKKGNKGKGNKGKGNKGKGNKGKGNKGKGNKGKAGATKKDKEKEARKVKAKAKAKSKACKGQAKDEEQVEQVEKKTKRRSSKASKEDKSKVNPPKAQLQTPKRKVSETPSPESKSTRKRSAKGEAVSFARRNPPVTERALAEWTAIRAAYQTKLSNLDYPSKHEDQNGLFVFHCKFQILGAIYIYNGFKINTIYLTKVFILKP